jgi:hypothetical protein
MLARAILFLALLVAQPAQAGCGFLWLQRCAHHHHHHQRPHRRPHVRHVTIVKHVTIVHHKFVKEGAAAPMGVPPDSAPIKPVK